MFVSDILANRPLPEGIRDNVQLHVGCPSEASTVEDYGRQLNESPDSWASQHLSSSYLAFFLKLRD